MATVSWPAKRQRVDSDTDTGASAGVIGGAININLNNNCILESASALRSGVSNQHPPPPLPPSVFPDAENFYSIDFFIVPDRRSSTHWTAGRWYARMSTKCKSIDDLMSAGSFTWAHFKVLRQFGKMLDEPGYGHFFPHGREYTLGIPEGPDGEYKTGATLTVYGKSIASLANLNLDVEFGPHLYRNIIHAEAKTPDGCVVYRFNASDPTININCIYDMTPLTGLWPWPRSSADDLEGGKDGGEGDFKALAIRRSPRTKSSD